MQYVYDDGSMIGQDASGEVYSKDINASSWVNDPTPAPAGWNVFTSDAQEQARLSAGYPANGAAWSDNAAMLGVTRLIDTATRAYATVKGSTPASYAGQDGKTYANGQNTPKPKGGVETLLLIGAAFLLLG